MGITDKQKRNERNSISGTANFFLNFVFFIYTILCMAPLILVFMVSISDENTITANGFSFFPQKFSALAYQYILKDSTQVIRSYGVTIFVTVVGTLLSVLITALFSYPLSRKDFKYRGFFSFLAIIPIMFNGGLVPWYMVYSSFLNLKDTIIVLILPMLVVPFYVIIMRTFFSTGLPDSIVESAKIDGASEYRIFFSIILQLSTPMLATIALFDILAYWNDWFLALMFISKNELTPLQFLLYRVQSTLQYLISMSSQTGHGTLTLADLPNQSAKMALVVVSIGPVILAYPFFQKYFVRGLTIGAIKG